MTLLQTTVYNSRKEACLYRPVFSGAIDFGQSTHALVSHGVLQQVHVHCWAPSLYFFFVAIADTVKQSESSNTPSFQKYPPPPPPCFVLLFPTSDVTQGVIESSKPGQHTPNRRAKVGEGRYSKFHTIKQLENTVLPIFYVLTLTAYPG